MLDELLQQWAALEPERCTKISDVHFLIREPEADDRRFWRIRTNATSEGLAKLQASVQGAIDTRGLRYRLENDANTHHAMVMEQETGRYAQSDHPEPAVALLRAYVNWLAIAVKAEAITGGATNA